MSIKLNGSTAGSVSLDAPASTTSSADIAFKLPVADGSAGQVLQTDGSGNLSWVTMPPQGVAVVDEFRTTNTQDINTTGDLANYWERNDNNFSQIGTGLTHLGSGIFQFGVTGIYLVSFAGSIYKTSGDNRFIGLRTYYSSDSGSNYNMMSLTYGSIKYISGETFDFIGSDVIIDVQNASTSRLKFNSTSSVIHTWTGGQDWAGTGNANTNTTSFRVIKLGDT